MVETGTLPEKTFLYISLDGVLCFAIIAMGGKQLIIMIKPMALY